MKKLSNHKILPILNSNNDWNIIDNKLIITYKLDSFMEVMSFANLTSDKAEQINHHPKIIIDYKSISFELTTHDIGGITDLDIQLANFIDETYNELYS